MIGTEAEQEGHQTLGALLEEEDWVASAAFEVGVVVAIVGVVCRTESEACARRIVAVQTVAGAEREHRQVVEVDRDYTVGPLEAWLKEVALVRGFVASLGLRSGQHLRSHNWRIVQFALAWVEGAEVAEVVAATVDKFQGWEEPEVVLDCY